MTWRGGALRGAVALLDRVAGPRLSVLIFHRVVHEPDPLFPHELHARRFDALMAEVASGFQVFTVGEAHVLWARGALPYRALAITFDDGYADNADVALPILQRHGLRATFFIASGFLDGGRMWNDAVIETLRSTRRDHVELSELGLGRLPLSTLAERRAAIDAVLPVIKYRPIAARARALELLAESCGHPTLPSDMMMSSGQVKGLHAAGMEIGGHTVRHPILTETGDEEAFAEIRDGRICLQQLTGAAVDVFAYPNGRPRRDYDARHVDMVRRAGFRCAVSTAPGVVKADADALQWQRFTPWAVSDLRWLAHLAGSRYSRPEGVVH